MAKRGPAASPPRAIYVLTHYWTAAHAERTDDWLFVYDALTGAYDGDDPAAPADCEQR
jgi:hypothetical protein